MAESELSPLLDSVRDAEAPILFGTAQSEKLPPPPSTTMVTEPSQSPDLPPTPTSDQDAALIAARSELAALIASHPIDTVSHPGTVPSPDKPVEPPTTMPEAPAVTFSSGELDTILRENRQKAEATALENKQADELIAQITAINAEQAKREALPPTETAASEKSALREELEHIVGTGPQQAINEKLIEEKTRLSTQHAFTLRDAILLELLDNLAEKAADEFFWIHRDLREQLVEKKKEYTGLRGLIKSAQRLFNGEEESPSPAEAVAPTVAGANVPTTLPEQGLKPGSLETGSQQSLPSEQMAKQSEEMKELIGVLRKLTEQLGELNKPEKSLGEVSGEKKEPVVEKGQSDNVESQSMPLSALDEILLRNYMADKEKARLAQLRFGPELVWVQTQKTWEFMKLIPAGAFYLLPRIAGMV